MITRKYHRLSGNFLIFDIEIVIYVIGWDQISGIAIAMYQRVNQLCRVDSVCIQVFCQRWQDFTYKILLRRLKVRNSYWGVSKGHFPDLLRRYYRTEANAICFAKRRAWENIQRHKRLKDIYKSVFISSCKEYKAGHGFVCRIIWRSALQPSGMNVVAAFSFGSAHLTKRLSLGTCGSILPMSLILLSANW